MNPMDPRTIAAMTDNGINQTIAKERGWTDKRMVAARERELAAYYNDRAKPAGCVPDYVNDLNAMHEVFNDLSDWLGITFGNNLIAAYKRRTGQHHTGAVMVCILKATARDWAEAFLLTVANPTSAGHTPHGPEPAAGVVLPDDWTPPAGPPDPSLVMGVGCRVVNPDQPGPAPHDPA